MTRSLARGDYSLLMAVESASRPDSWYRVLTDRRTGALSCDCPPWTFNHDQRTCTHSELGARLVGAGGNRPSDRAAAPSAVSPLITATQQQWPGLQGVWSIEERTAPIKENPFRFVLLRLDLGNGGTATGTVAFAERHHHSQAHIEAWVAGWAGYAIAAEVARLGGFPLAGQPPEHFLDVPSVHYAAAQRVYRLRRDSAKAHERRVRVFERGQYSKDFCIVRGQDVPEADWWLGLFLGLMSDEQSTLSVVGRHNVFSPFSDGEERETVPPVWVTP